MSKINLTESVVEVSFAKAPVESFIMAIAK